MHELHIENIAAKAKRANERVKESVARKLRFEAAKVEKASQAIERAERHVDAKKVELTARREAAKARRQALLESVRAAREARQAEQLARQLALAELEDKASAKRTKTVDKIALKGRAAVKHAVAVAAAFKAKKRDDLAAAAVKLEAKLGAAELRRQELREAAAAALQAATSPDKVRLTKLHEEARIIAEKRAKFITSMGRAVGKRAAIIDSLAAKARAENARVAAVASDVKEQRDELLPAARRHTLAVKQQGAEVNRLSALKAKTDTIVAVAYGVPKPSKAIALDSSNPNTPCGTPPGSPPKGDAAWPWPTAPAHHDTVKIRFLGPDGGAGRVPTMSIVSGAAPPELTKRPVAFVVPAGDHPFVCQLAHAPPAHVLTRLLFTPKLLLATAAARHAGAAGRRTMRRAFIIAKASHMGTVRVAKVRARLATRHELLASCLHVQEERAAQNADAHLRHIIVKARMATNRSLAAAMTRSSERLAVLNAAIASDERRQAASLRRAKRLNDVRAGRYEQAARVAARARRTGIYAARAIKCARNLYRCSYAGMRRAAIIDLRVAKARRMALLPLPERITRAAAALPAAEPKLKLVLDLTDSTNEKPTVTLRIVDEAQAKADDADAAAMADLQARIAAHNATIEAIEIGDDAGLPNTAASPKQVRFDERPIIGGGALGGGGITLNARQSTRVSSPLTLSDTTETEQAKALAWRRLATSLGGGNVDVKGAHLSESVPAIVQSAGGVRQAINELATMKTDLAARIAAVDATNAAKVEAAKTSAWQRFADAVSAHEEHERMLDAKWKELATAVVEAGKAAKWRHLAIALKTAADCTAAVEAASTTDAELMDSVASGRMLSADELAQLKTSAAQGTMKGTVANKVKVKMNDTVNSKGGAATMAAKLSAAEDRAAAAVAQARAALAEAAAAQAVVAAIKDADDFEMVDRESGGEVADAEVADDVADDDQDEEAHAALVVVGTAVPINTVEVSPAVASLLAETQIEGDVELSEGEVESSEGEIQVHNVELAAASFDTVDGQVDAAFLEAAVASIESTVVASDMGEDEWQLVSESSTDNEA